MNVKKLFIITFCVCFLFINNISAQRTGSIGGIVTDYDGATVTNAQVIVKSETDKTIKTTVSNASGEYKISMLTPGLYEILVKSATGLSYKRRGLNIEAGVATKLNTPLEYGSDCEKPDVEPIKLSDANKAEIVNQILVESLVKKKLPDYGLLANQKNAFVISTKNIEAEWIKPLENVNLKLMTEEEIQQKADTEGDFLYVSLSEIKVKGECVAVTITNSWAVGKKSSKFYLSGGGTNYIFRKTLGKFTGRTVGGWIS